jgi:SAM-dependent methyltransferase
MAIPNEPDEMTQQTDTDENMTIRQEIHEQYTVPKVNYPEWVIDSMQWRGDERVLDVGCGLGTYYKVLVEKWPEIDYCGVDISEEILRKHPKADATSVADAESLPFPDDSFDVVMANHMLFHVSDIDVAIDEFQRVLKPHGVMLAATNSVGSMAELQVLLRRAILLLSRSGMQVQPPIPPSALFGLENGARRLSRHFFAVARFDLPSKLVFEEVDPLIRYLESTRANQEDQLPEEVSWEDVMSIMNQQITHLITHMGELTINKLSGVLIASDDGGFVQRFAAGISDSVAE